MMVKKDIKFYTGIILLIYSIIPYLLAAIIIPFFHITGALLAGLGLLIISAEIAFVISVILLGAPLIQHIKKNLLSNTFFPSNPISKIRHYCGVILFFTSFIPYFLVEVFLLFHAIAQHHTLLLLLLLFGDFLFIISILVLGKTFWVKLKNLFRQEKTPPPYSQPEKH
jgi:hypothetical protein